MYVISVSKTYKHRGRFIVHKPKTKKHWQIMYYGIDEDTEELKLYSKYVNSLQAFYYKFKKYYKRKFVCVECGYVFEMLVKKRQYSIDVDCPNCEE
jgi:hypothetical protein